MKTEADFSVASDGHNLTGFSTHGKGDGNKHLWWLGRGSAQLRWCVGEWLGEQVPGRGLIGLSCRVSGDSDGVTREESRVCSRINLVGSGGSVQASKLFFVSIGVIY